MKFTRMFETSAAVLAAAVMLSGCATTPKKMEPVATPEKEKGELLKGMDVVQQPALEPEWADFVKEKYPQWRRHYWVDRGQWGNRGYIVGKAPETTEPVAEAQITPLPPAPAAAPVIEETPAPKVEAPVKPDKYIVQKGDCLWKIAGKLYRNPLKWPQIYRANKAKIKNPNKIYPGQVLVIPWE